jgi:YVTN family beta-propeller protein
MILAALIALQQAPAQPAPRRVVPDPGIVVTNPRVSPAGVQSVFDGRVTGVRFTAPGELWVIVPGSAFHLSWSDNRVIARGPLDGRSGVQGVVIDPVTSRALVTSVGRLRDTTATVRLPGSAPLVSRGEVAQLRAFSADTGTRLAPTFSSGALGDFMAGAPAVARRAGADGRRVIVVPLPANDALAVLDADRGTPLRLVPLGVAPIAAVVSADGATAYVSVLGGAKPRAGDRASRQCCDPRAEAVRIDTRGLAMPGSVMRVDVAKGLASRDIAVGLHPTGIVWDESRSLLYVANGNSDAITVIDTRRDGVVATIRVAPFRERQTGLAPTALALSPDARTLFVALGGINAVAMYDVSTRGRTSFLGLIPTGWYPTSLDVSSDGRHLAVGALLGVGSGTGRESGKTGRYVHANRGSVNVIAVPGARELAAYTTAVAQNNRLTLATSSTPSDVALAARPSATRRAIPERPGEPSTIEHVVFIVRENRTYDQVLSDLGRGARDSSLLMFGADVTPNAHALAEEFVVLDHFFASGGNSADGHQWLTQANETEYPLWPLYYGRTYPSEGNDPLAYSSGGFLWQSAQEKGKRVVVFGEYAPAASDSIASVRSDLLAHWRDSSALGSAHFRALLAKRYDTKSAIPSLDRALVREYPGWTQEVPDVVKAEDILDHLREWRAAKQMPHLVMIILPSDHTVGTSPGWCTPRACVADNDYALGRIVDGLSHSEFWPRMGIFVVEDDAQNGVDHIDGHRTVALAISPFTRRRATDSTFYNQASMVKTIELILGLPAMSLFDLVATDMRASFISPEEQPNLAPYTARQPRVSLFEMNQRVGDIRGAYAPARRQAALASSRMNFSEPDAAPSDALNRILWHEARGWGTPFPGVKQSLFFPLSRDLDDDDREVQGKSRPSVHRQ